MKTEIYKIELVLANTGFLTESSIIGSLEKTGLRPMISHVQVVETELDDNNPLMTGNGVQTYVEKLFSPDLEMDPQLAYWQAMNGENED
jgi:hypothetical protein